MSDTQKSIQTTSHTTGHEAPIRRRDAGDSDWTYRPNVDVLDLAEEVRIVADMPGAVREDIQLGFDEGVLTIQAPVPPRVPAGARWLSQEYGVGGFHRRFAVDDTVDPEAITAEYVRGTLTVHLPKRTGARPRQIPVSG